MSELLPSVVPAMAWALLDFVWQGLLVGWGAALLLALLRKARPQARYAVACAALLLCAALPVAGTVQRVLDDAADTTTSLHLLARQDVAPAGQVAAAPVIAVAADRVASWERRMQDQLPLVILFWACGAGVLALRMSLGLAWVRRQSRPGAFATAPDWQARLDRLAARMGIARRVVLGIVDDLRSPVTAGCWRPVVLVPASLLTGMPPDLLEALLAHELAHVRRFDYLVNLFQSAIEILLFYHPTVWWLSNRIRVEREQVADDLAASTLGEPRRLALALSELDLFQLATPQLAPAAQGGNLMSRIKRLVRPESEPLNWKMAVPILGLAVFAAFATQSAVAEQAKPQPAPAASPAPAPAPAPMAAPAADRKQHLAYHNSRGKRDNAYALVRATDHGTNLSGDSADWGEINEVKRSVTGDFLWFRDGGKTWVVEDPSVLARASAAWANVDKLGKEMDGLGRQMDVHGKKMEALGREMEVAGARFRPDEKQMRQLERNMEKLSEQMAKLGDMMEDASGAERKRIERDMHELGQKMHALGDDMNRQANSGAQQQARADMDAIGRRMHEAGKPMNELGKQMNSLGKQMEKETYAAEKATRELIRDAKEKGLAREVPGRG